MNPLVVLRAAVAGSVLMLGTAHAAAPIQDGGSLSARMDRTITLRIQGAPLRETLAALEAASGLRLNPAWIDERDTEGLDPEREVELDGRPRPALRVLELILQQADPTATWQVDADGALEIGPRSRLNEHRSVKVYAVRDLLVVVPEYWEVPTIDLQAALQPGSASPLREPGEQRKENREERGDRARDLISLITSTVEPQQWSDTGGSGATIRLFQDALIVNAPGYIHRQLSGR